MSYITSITCGIKAYIDYMDYGEGWYMKLGKLSLKKTYKLIAKSRSGENIEIELDHRPAGAIEIRDLLGVENICEEYESVRVYENKKLIYVYPCTKKRKESDVDQTFEELKKELIKEVVEQLRQARSISPKDIIAQYLAEFQISRDLYKALKEIYEEKEKSSSGFGFLKDIVEALNILRQLSPQQPQVATQVTREQVLSETKNTLSNTANAVIEAVKILQNMSPEEREKLIKEAMQYISNFRSQAESTVNK